jgi:folate-binding protein YgfZ
MDTRLDVDGALPLAHWGSIRARGADAASFLQGQLTNDVLQLDSTQARLAGFCSAKGRLQASFVVWKLAPDDLLLACAASVLPATLKRLSMFVLRARCKLSDGGAEFALHGAAGASARGLIGETPVWGRREIAGGSLVRLPDVEGVARCMVALGTGAALPALPALAAEHWRALEVRSGIPLIEAATADQFVPQMLNYELIGGVDFKKGCYPGQEIVARSQYRGTIKRRMFMFESDAMLAAGDEVFHSGDAAQPAGMVVNAAPLPDAGTVALVEVKLAVLDAGELHAGAPGGALLRRCELPYELPSEATLAG